MSATLLHALRKMPFGRVLLAFITGILLQYYLDSPIWLWLSIAAITVAGLVLYRWLPVQARFAYRWLQGIAILLCMAMAGASAIWLRDVRHQQQWLGGGGYAPGDTLLVTLEEPPVARRASFKATATANGVLHKGKWVKVAGRLLVYFAKDSVAPPAYGAQIIITAALHPVTGYRNPGAFDYETYCARQQLYHQVYVTGRDYRLLAADRGSAGRAWLFHVRQHTLDVIHRYVLSPQASGIAAALLIGYREELDKELLHVYADTGVIHIIAISGMHLAMIYGLLSLVLSWVHWPMFRKVLRPLILLVVLWLFTLLAGAVPSILRSAVMFSFMVVGEAFSRRHNSCNNLAASAFCLLVYDPFFLWDMGFQLSYMAVLGIILFQKPIYNFIYCHNRLLDYLWQLTAITLAAQVLTLPVVLYRLHQFPHFFVVTNLVVVPLSGIILYLEILLLLCCRLPAIAVWIGKGIVLLIQLMNEFIRQMSRLPFALSNGIAFSGLQAVLLFGLIGCCCWGIWQKKANAIFIAVALCTGMVAVHSITGIRCSLQKRLVVYNIPAQTAIEFIHGHRSYFTGDTLPLHDPGLLEQHIQPAHTLWQVQQHYLVGRGEPVKLFTYAGKKVACISGECLPASGSRPLTVDVLILGGKAGGMLAYLSGRFRSRQVVFDSSNPLWKIEKWKKDYEGLHLQLHSVPRDGAFVMEF